jgi:membrane protein DedA with SNARE-associated domain
VLSLSGLVGQFPYLGLFLLLILGGIGFPFPEDTTLILCGFLISQDIIRPLPAFLNVYAGLLIADFFLYSMGRRYGRLIVTHRRFQRIVSPERLTFIEDKFRRRGVLVILLGRHIFGLRAQIFLTAGITRMDAGKFLLTDAFSALFTIALMVGAGYAGGYGMQVLERDLLRIKDFSIIAVIAMVSVYFLWRYLKFRRGDPRG